MKEKKLIRLLSRMEDYLVLFFCVGMFCVGSYGLYDSYLVYHQANDDSILKYKPGYEGEEPEKEIQGRMTAWLTLEGTGIDYPVMQGESNFEYLNKNPYGEYSLSGSIFLDCRNAADFSDEYSLLYGHHMEKGYMFGDLDFYRNEEFFNAHEEGTLILRKTDSDEKENAEEQIEIRIISVMEALATDEVIFQVGKDVSGDKIQEILDKIEDTAIYKRPYEGNELIGFSTCKYPDTTERTVVIGELVREKLFGNS